MSESSLIGSKQMMVVLCSFLFFLFGELVKEMKHFTYVPEQMRLSLEG